MTRWRSGLLFAALAASTTLAGLGLMALCPVRPPDRAFSERVAAWRALPPTARPERR